MRGGGCLLVIAWQTIARRSRPRIRLRTGGGIRDVAWLAGVHERGVQQ
jgi:hypothetical protein